MSWSSSAQLRGAQCSHNPEPADICGTHESTSVMHWLTIKDESYSRDREKQGWDNKALAISGKGHRVSVWTVTYCVRGTQS